MTDIVDQLTKLAARPHSHRFWEISEIANQAIARIAELEQQQKTDWENINLKANAIERWTNTSAEQHQRIAELEAERAEDVREIAKVIYREAFGCDPDYATNLADGTPYGRWKRALDAAAAIRQMRSKT